MILNNNQRYICEEGSIGLLNNKYLKTMIKILCIFVNPLKFSHVWYDKKYNFKWMYISSKKIFFSTW